MATPEQRRTAIVAVVLLGAIVLAVGAVNASSHPVDRFQRVRHIVVIYQENHSFDNLWGGWPGVDGLTGRLPTQVAQDGRPLRCLPQTDVNLTSPPLTPVCTATLADSKVWCPAISPPDPSPSTSTSRRRPPPVSR